MIVSRETSADLAEEFCKCGSPTGRPGQRQCPECHADYMRGWRRANRIVKRALRQLDTRPVFAEASESTSELAKSLSASGMSVKRVRRGWWRVNGQRVSTVDLRSLATVLLREDRPA